VMISFHQAHGQDIMFSTILQFLYPYKSSSSVKPPFSLEKGSMAAEEGFWPTLHRHVALLES